MENSQIENNKDQLLPTPTRKSLLSNLSKRQKISLATLSFFVALVPLGTSAALLTTRLNSRAYLPATPPTPPILCNNPLKTLNPQKPCKNVSPKDQKTNRNERNQVSYMFANITCQNGYKELYKSQTCLTEQQLRAKAEQICQSKTYCPSPTVTNIAPIIQTGSLPLAMTGRSYSYSIIVTDQNQKDSISVTASSLPNNLKLLCKKTNDNNKVECLISGTPQKIGVYNIDIKATDNRGATTSKSLKLTVQNRSQPQKI